MYKGSLEENGFVVYDDILEKDDFIRINNYLKKVFNDKSKWSTLIKYSNDIYRRNYIESSDIKKISKNIIEDKSKFNYIYHKLDDSKYIIEIIQELVLKKWAEFFDIEDFKEFNFSITSFTNGCFLDWHNDSNDDKTFDKDYKYTILLYFGENKVHNINEKLQFSYKGIESLIDPIPNRSVLFIPNKESMHRVSSLQSSISNNECFDRIAFSGWLI